MCPAVNSDETVARAWHEVHRSSVISLSATRLPHPATTENRPQNMSMDESHWCVTCCGHTRAPAHPTIPPNIFEEGLRSWSRQECCMLICLAWRLSTASVSGSFPYPPCRGHGDGGCRALAPKGRVKWAPRRASSPWWGDSNNSACPPFGPGVPAPLRSGGIALAFRNWRCRCCPDTRLRPLPRAAAAVAGSIAAGWILSHHLQSPNK